MIEYEPCVRTRNKDTLARLREMAVFGPLDPETRIKRASAVIVDAMAELHGGEWLTQIDHQRRSVWTFSL